MSKSGIAKLSLDPALTRALLVGVGDYKDLPQIQPVKGNLDAMAALLMDPEVLGLHQDHIIPLRDMRHDDILHAIDNFIKDQRHREIQTLLLYYVGHGLRESFGSQELYLAGVNTFRNGIDYSGIPFNKIKQKLEKSHIQSRIFILDACYSGLATMAEGGEQIKEEELSIKGTYVLSSSSEDEKSFFDTAAENTFFTADLIACVREGLPKEKPFVSLDDLFEQLQARATHSQPRRRNNLSTRDFYLFRNRWLEPDRYWHELLQAPDVERYEQYLAYFPEGPHREEALWQVACSQPQDKRGYRAYLDQYPRGAHARDAIERIEVLDQEARYQEALRRGEAGLRRFLLDYPDGSFAGDARAALSRILAAEQEAHLRETEAHMTTEREAESQHRIREPYKQSSSPPKDIPDIEMIRIPGGTFLMGEGENQHTVIIDSFEIGKYPITQRQWKAIMNDNPSDFKGDDLPVESVSWYDCQRFISLLNEMSGLHFRLPTDAEWEYAAGGGEKNRTRWAGTNDKKQLGDYAWYTEWYIFFVIAAIASWRGTHSVGKKKPNALGLYDMSGNVMEWCEDDWHMSYQGAPNDGSAWVDNPRGVGLVLRGGSWFSGSEGCRVAERLRCNHPNNRGSHLGFRLARSF